MKKILLTAAAGLLITAGVTATVLNTGKEKKEPPKKAGKECSYQPAKCCKMDQSAACY